MSDNDDIISTLIALGFIALIGGGVYLVLKAFGGYEKGDKVNGEELISEEKEEGEDQEALQPAQDKEKKVEHVDCEGPYCNKSIPVDEAIVDHDVLGDIHYFCSTQCQDDWWDDDYYYDYD